MIQFILNVLHLESSQHA